MGSDVDAALSFPPENANLDHDAVLKRPQLLLATHWCNATQHVLYTQEFNEKKTSIIYNGLGEGLGTSFEVDKTHHFHFFTQRMHFSFYCQRRSNLPLGGRKR